MNQYHGSYAPSGIVTPNDITASQRNSLTLDTQLDVTESLHDSYVQIYIFLDIS